MCLRVAAYSNVHHPFIRIVLCSLAIPHYSRVQEQSRSGSKSILSEVVVSLASGCLIAVYNNTSYSSPHLSSHGKVPKAASPLVAILQALHIWAWVDRSSRSISEERRLPKLHSSKAFTAGYLQEIALYFYSLVVALMFVYSWYRIYIRWLFLEPIHTNRKKVLAYQ